MNELQIHFYKLYKSSISQARRLFMVRHQSSYKIVDEEFINKHKSVNPYTDPQPPKCTRACKGCVVKDWDCQTPVIITSCNRGNWDPRPFSVLTGDTLDEAWEALNKLIDYGIENEKETCRVQS